MLSKLEFAWIVTLGLTIAPAHCASVDAYNIKYTKNVLSRSVFYAPGWGGLYKEKWEELVKLDPNTRAVAIHMHGCGGLGWNELKVADFYIRNGIATITPDFVGRPNNKVGCPGKSGDDQDQLMGGKIRFDQGVYTARNPERMQARVDDLEAVIRYVKSITDKPIIISGHSEGARTVYHFNKLDPQVKGAVMHNQSCSASFDHIFRLPTSYPAYQIIEVGDPWADGSRDCSHHYKNSDRVNLTLIRQSGYNHKPLNNDEARLQLKNWLDLILGGEWKFKPVMSNESFLPAVQKNFEVPDETSTSK